MLTELPILYWDACVFLSYINDDPDRIPHIEAIMQLAAQGKDFQIITSDFSIVEVAFAAIEQTGHALSEEQERRIARLWQFGSPVQRVEFHEIIAQDAQQLIRRALAGGWSLKPGDAIHLATADFFAARYKNLGLEFHTYDDKLDKFKTITSTHFDITRPFAAQPMLIVQPLPLEDADSAIADTSANADGEQKEETSEGQQQNTDSYTDTLRASDSGSIGNEAGKEANQETVEEPAEEQAAVTVVPETPKPASDGGLNE